MVDITNLETQLVAKIAALTGSETTEDLMILKKACDNTSVDTTALDAAIQADLTALSGSNTDVELLIANRASGLSGGGSFVNESRFFNSNSPNILANTNAEVWVRSGVGETDVASYPGATVSTLEAGVSLGDSFLWSGEDSDITCSCVANGFIYMVGNTGNSVFKYTMDGVYTGVNWSFNAQTAGKRITGIGFDGTYFYICDGSSGNGNVWRYTEAGVYDSFTFQTLAKEPYPSGMYVDSTGIYVCGNTSDGVEKFSLAGAWVEKTLSVIGQTTNPVACSFDGEYWFVANGSNTYFIYDAAGAYTGETHVLTDIDNSVVGFMSEGINLWFVGEQWKKLTRVYGRNYSYVGNAYENTNGNGLTSYMRIK